MLIYLYITFNHSISFNLMYWFLQARTLAVAKRALDNIVKQGGYIHKIESMGLADLPHRMKGDTKGR